MDFPWSEKENSQIEKGAKPTTVLFSSSLFSYFFFSCPPKVFSQSSTRCINLTGSEPNQNQVDRHHSFAIFLSKRLNQMWERCSTYMSLVETNGNAGAFFSHLVDYVGGERQISWATTRRGRILRSSMVFEVDRIPTILLF
jgi:hypothetical protein